MFVEPLLEKIRNAINDLDEKKTLLPIQFFRIRLKTEPRASSKTMYSFAGVAYLLTLGVFVALIVTQSQIRTKESTIVKHDMSGQNGWSCNMLSVVSEQTVYDSSEPTLDYSLVKISELGSTCASDLATASPCDRPLVIRSSPVDTNFPSTPEGPLVSWKGEILYYVETRFNINEGMIESDGTIVVTAVGPTGQGYGLDGTDVVDFDGDIVCTLSFTGTGVLLNDNLYNMYLLATNENILYSVDLASGQLTVLLNSAISGTFSRAAVYRRSGVVELYYLTTATFSDPFDLKRNVNGATTTLLTSVARANGYFSNIALYLDSTGTHAYVNTAPSNVARYNVITDPGVLDVLSGDLDMYGWGFLDDTSLFYNTFDALSYFYDLPSGVSTIIKHTAGGTEMGWFTCGNELLDALPSSAAAATSSCSSNGLLWKATFQSAFYGTAAAYEAKMLTAAGKTCTGSALYDRICKTVSHLPPYICEREVGQPIFTVLSTALANAQFFLMVLLLAFAFAIDRPVETATERTEKSSAKVAPVSDAVVASASAVPSAQVPFASGAASKSTLTTVLDRDIEMADVFTAPAVQAGTQDSGGQRARSGEDFGEDEDDEDVVSEPSLEEDELNCQ
jgi:hypothetical protein